LNNIAKIEEYFQIREFLQYRLSDMINTKIVIVSKDPINFVFQLKFIYCKNSLLFQY